MLTVYGATHKPKVRDFRSFPGQNYVPAKRLTPSGSISARRSRLVANAPDAAAIIDGLRTPGVGGDISSILNKIVVEWAAFRNKMALSSV